MTKGLFTAGKTDGIVKSGMGSVQQIQEKLRNGDGN
jgi:hypothetical protein